MQLEKSVPNRMTQTQALPTQPFSCPAWALSQSQTWPPSLGKALASVWGAENRQGSAVFQKPVVLRVEKQNSLSQAQDA